MQRTLINYVEFTAPDLEQIKAFYRTCFGWTFTDYGDTYMAFSDSGLDGGFAQSDEPVAHGALVVLYHERLAEIEQAIIAAGGTILQPTFSFPGGRRVHFRAPAGNELAVWSDQ